jgi:hypothetical protein
VRNVVSRATQVACVDATHPVLREAAGWSNVHIARYVQVTPAASDRILITLNDDAPLLIERKIGAGRVLMLTSPLAREWNDLATHPVFVQFMADTASYMTDAEASTSSAQVGGVLMTGLNARQGGQIFDPKGQRVLALGDTSVPDRIVPEHSGFYEIRTAGASRWIAVNTDPRESDLARMSAVALQRWQSLQKPFAPNTSSPDTHRSAQDANRISIGYACLLVCLVLLLAEMMAANHFLAVRREVPR